MSKSGADLVINELHKLGSEEKAKSASRYFKVKKGEYGEHDKFIGGLVVEIRALAKRLGALSFADLETLLKSEYNDARLFALLNLRIQYEKSDFEGKEAIVKFYLEKIDCINNWNLVDLSTQFILGDFCTKTNSDILFKLAGSANIWHRRIAIVGSYSFIRQNKFDITIKLAKILLNDAHDLMHKAVGWMLREIGKRDGKVLREFLDEFFEVMPRVMLRYSIEKFDVEEKKKYMKKLRL